MELLEAAEVSEQTGVANDFRGKPGKRQVTVLSADVWRNICADLGEVIPWTMRRSNLLVEGIDLPQAAGSLLKIGNLMLRVMTEIDPCSRMDEQCQGLTESLRPDWRGGVGCSVLKGASVRLGDAVSIDADDRP